MPPRPRPEPSNNRRPAKKGPKERRSGPPDRSATRRPDRVPEARGGRVARVVEVADEEDSGDDADRMRLQKFLAMAGVDSRRNCEEYIRTGRVTVDAEVVTDPARAVNPKTQDIRLDSERLRMPRFRYFLVNKPKGVLCTNHDPQGRPRAVDLVPVKEQRMFTVGRLDENTEGMLLITNDGDLAQKLAHPRFEVIRRYRCHVAGIPQLETLKQLREGMYFAEGYFKFRSVHIYRRRGQSVILELELQEGKNREIRRLMARVGHKVLALERIAFGPLSLGSLAPGRHRELMPYEIHELRHFAEHGEKPAPKGGKTNDGFGYRSGQTRGRRRRPEDTPERRPAAENAAARSEAPRPPASPLPSLRMPAARTPAVRTSDDRTPADRTPNVRTRAARTPAARTPSTRPQPARPAAPKRTPRPAAAKKSGARKPLRPGTQKPVSSINKGRDRRRNK